MEIAIFSEKEKPVLLDNEELPDGWVRLYVNGKSRRVKIVELQAAVDVFAELCNTHNTQVWPWIDK